MYRHPLLDLYAGAFMALGGHMALLLPQRIFLAMLATEFGPGATRNIDDETR